jgi:serine/threonine protein kinase
MALAVGEILQDRYRVDTELGRGGMAAVYWAWDTHLDLPVAVKEMIPQPRLGPKALGQLRRQFKREAQILARLDHPNLVRVMDSFSQRESEYLVMNFVEGESLADRVDRVGALPEAQVLNWADQLLSALAYCHSRGVIHRDVKSHNVIIRPDEQAVLVDFGLVKLWDPSDPYTKTVMRGMGTPAFAPPEQFEADAEHTDERSDVYSVGATLYHVLSGNLPQTATLRTATPEKFVPLRNTAPEVSEQTETAVMKAMELARSKRWQSTDEMAEALKAAELSIADRQRSPSFTVPLLRGGTVVMPGGRSTTQGERKRVPMWIGALSILALLLVAAGLMIRPGGEGDRSTPMPSPERTATASTPAILTERDTATLPASTAVLLPSPTPTETNTPTDTPSPTATSTATATPSLTPTHSPTSTATASPTTTRTPTLTHTATPTERVTLETPTPVATPTPTVKPTVALLELYDAPKLLEPTSSQIFVFNQRQTIHLLWIPTSLAGDHWYEVQVQMAGDAELRSQYWTKENWWDLGPDYYRSGDYFWRVVIVQGKEGDVAGAVSPPSETWHFEWLAVAPTSTPGPKPTNTSRPQATKAPTQPPPPTKEPIETRVTAEPTP